MTDRDLVDRLRTIFEDDSLYGFAAIDGELMTATGCRCALVTLSGPDAHVYPDRMP